MLSLVTSLPVQSQAKTADEVRPDFSEVRKLIKAEMAARSIPSLSLAVVRRGEPEPDTTKPSSSFVGNWAGNVHTYRAPMPLVFSISDSGNVHVQLGSDSGTLVNKPKFARGALIGRFTGKLNVDEDTGSEPYDIDFELYPKGNMLYGSVTTRPRPSSLYVGRLSYWVELRKRSAR